MFEEFAPSILSRQALDKKFMKIYLVGGAVRDKALNIPVRERDWVVVGASASEMLENGYRAVGKDFPVYLHPDSGEEYALARTERKTRPGYTGFDFFADPSVTLEQDLSRRDLTINAMAMDDDGNIVDPFHGLDDLEHRLLRHVSPAFCEDPVRILRVARFAARYHCLGFRVADDTMALMREMVASGEVDSLVPERVWKEFSRALGESAPDQFVLVLRQCGALAKILPELDALFGVEQPAHYHPEIDTGVHSLMSLQQAARWTEDVAVRFAALTHDLGKGLTPKHLLPSHHGHEVAGLPLLKQLCDRIKVPNECRDLARLVMEFHTHCHRAFALKGSTLNSLLKKLDARRQYQRFNHYLLACKADACGRTGFESRNYPQANYLLLAFALTQEITNRSVLDEGFSGAAVGEEIERRQIARLNELVKRTKSPIPDV